MNKKVDFVKEHQLWENLRRMVNVLSEVLIIVAIVFMAKWIEPIILQILDIQDGRGLLGGLIAIFLLLGLALRETVKKLEEKEKIRK